MARSFRFKKRISDLTGFDFLESEMHKEKGLWYGPGEWDEPPPSKLSLGGEGEIVRGDYFRASSDIFTIDADKLNPTVFVTAADGITPNFQHPYMRVTGSNSAVTISANPRIARGANEQLLTLYGVGSTITLQNGNGLRMMGSAPFVLGSGNSITFIFNTADLAWQETSRFSGEGIGA